MKKVGEWSSVLELTLKDPVSQKAADILNTLAIVYNEAAIQDKNRVASSTYDFINERLKFLTAELSESEGELESFKTRKVIPGDIMTNVTSALEEFKVNDAELSRLQLQQDIVGNLESILNAATGPTELLVSLHNGVLSIAGTRSAEERKENESFYLYERQFGSFSRSFALPDTADGDKVEAKLEQGILTLTIGKKVEAKPRKIAFKKS